MAPSGYAADPLDAAVEMAWFRGVTVVASAGNAGPGPSTVTVPGNDPYVLTVGAFDDNQTAAAAGDAPTAGRTAPAIESPQSDCRPGRG